MARRSVDDYEDKYDHYHRKAIWKCPEGDWFLRLLRHLESSFMIKEMLARAAKGKRNLRGNFYEDP